LSGVAAVAVLRVAGVAAVSSGAAAETNDVEVAGPRGDDVDEPSGRRPHSGDGVVLDGAVGPHEAGAAVDASDVPAAVVYAADGPVVVVGGHGLLVDVVDGVRVDVALQGVVFVGLHHFDLG